MERDKALGQLDDYFLNGSFYSELARRVAFNTESNLEGCEATLQSYLDDEIVPYLSAMGSVVSSGDGRVLLVAGVGFEPTTFRL